MSEKKDNEEEEEETEPKRIRSYGDPFISVD